MHPLTRRLDPSLVATVSDIFSYVASLPQSHAVLVNVVLPRLSNAMEESRQDKDSPVPAAAFTIIDSIVSERPKPLGEGFFASFAGSFFVSLSGTEDQAIIQVSPFSFSLETR